MRGTDRFDARERALVTGASRGIGLELARVLARNGHDLVLTARSEDELLEHAADLEEEHGVSVRVVPGDLSDPATPARIHRDLTENGIAVGVLVNNAGFGSQGPFHEQELTSQLDMVRLNVEALTQMTGLFLPDMIRRGGGRILQVASTAAFQPGPLMAVYYASKAYVLHFSEAVAAEVKEKGVTVTTLCPGPVATGFQERAEMKRAPLVTGAIPMLTARRVAEAGYKGMMKGKRVVIPGFMNKLGAFSVRLSPRKLAARITKMLNAEE